MSKTFTVNGKLADHTVHVLAPMTFGTTEEAVAFRKSPTDKRMVFTPENGATLNSANRVAAWLRTYLKKDGWPTPTVWNIETVTIPGYETSFSAVLTN